MNRRNFIMTPLLAIAGEALGKVVYVNTVSREQWRDHVIEGVKEYEKYRPTPYICPGGKRTIGYGATGKDIRGLNFISEHDAHELLVEQMERKAAYVDRIVDVDLTPFQYWSLVSFTFNVGQKNLRNLVDGENRLNGGNYESVENIMPLYRRANGEILRGLVLRRKWEVATFKGYKIEPIKG